MSDFSIRDELTRTFELASLRAQGELLKGNDWKHFQAIRNRYAEAREREIRAFHDEYDTRLEQARKKLIDEAGAPNRKLIHRWFGVDRFEPVNLERQAHRMVHGEHHAVMAKLEEGEIREVEALLETASPEAEYDHGVQKEFARVTDRRSGTERRQPTDTASSAWAHARSRGGPAR